MAYKKMTWEEKLNAHQEKYPKTLKFKTNWPCSPALIKMGAKKGDTVVITPAIEVNEVMKKVPKGKVITLKEICEKLAKKHKVDYCCTLTCGIFTMIAANAAEEMGTIVPWWRTLKMKGELNPKFPGNLKKQKKLLEKEGHKIIKRGVKNIRYFVKDYEKKLVKV